MRKGASRKAKNEVCLKGRENYRMLNAASGSERISNLEVTPSSFCGPVVHCSIFNL
jgi:hypothetical protein